MNNISRDIGDDLVNDLEQLEICISSTLGDAVRRLVRNKYLLDKVASDNFGVCIEAELSGSASGGLLEGADFFSRVFPFGFEADAVHDFFALVPTKYTLGCSWRWRLEQLGDRKQEEYLAVFTKPPSGSGLKFHTGYLWIKSLGLLLAVEGKNRVDFLREKGVQWFPARVSEAKYPDASRLVLYSVTVNAQNECWAVLDSQWLERVPHPAWTKPVLQAYGALVDQEWPHEFPHVQSVAAEFNYPDKQPINPYRKSLDLHRISAEYARKNELALCSLWQLRGIVRFRSLYIPIFFVAAYLASSIAVLEIMQPWSWQKAGIVVAGICLGGSLVAGLFFFGSLFRAKRKTIEQRNYDASL
jgi:hypothetical protein